MITTFAPEIKNIEAMKGAHFLSIDQLDSRILRGLLEDACDRGMSPGYLLGRTGTTLAGKTIGLDFRQPSTRTFESFETAIRQLGGHPSEVRTDGTSREKGESWQDEILVRSVYCNGMVIRHNDPTFIYDVSELFDEFNIHCPLINAGNGTDEHPTQSLGDLATISHAMSYVLNGMKIVIVGDLLNGRTVHSLLKGLNALGKLGITVYTRAVPGLDLPDEFGQQCINLAIKEQPTDGKLRDCLRKSNIWYWTRTQREHPDSAAVDPKDDLRLDADFANDLRNCQNLQAIMHPLPRVGEIDPLIDHHPAAVYLGAQLRWNVTMRMLLLKAIFQH